MKRKANNNIENNNDDDDASDEQQNHTKKKQRLEVFTGLTFCLAGSILSRDKKLEITNNGGTLTTLLSKNVPIF